MNGQHPKWEQQVELEERMTGLGQERFWRRIERAKKVGNETATDYGQRLMKEAIAPLSAAIRSFITDAITGKPGRRVAASTLLTEIHPDTAAFLTTKTVLDSASINLTLTFVAISVGRTIEDEIRFRFYRGENPAYYDAIMRNQRERKKRPRHIRKVLILKMGRAGSKWVAWSVADKLQVGMKCIDLLIESTGLVEAVLDTTRVKKGKRRATKRLVLTAETQKWIENRNAATELLTPAYLPMVMPPKPWTSPFSGGYWTDVVRHVRLVKTSNRDYLEDLRHTEMPAVYEAINAIQDTAWRVNTSVLETLARVWDAGLEVGQLPAREDFPLPTKPHDIETNEEARKAWSKAATRVHEKNERLRSKRLQVAKTLWVAEMFKDDAAIYFPHQMDFRGRVYAVSMFLNPQACDYAKALLTFSNGKPINNEAAAEWLMIHGANTYGYDKASLDERVQWVKDNRPRILACASDPLANRWWCDADKPWQFLAFCFDFTGYYNTGYGYVSALPIALDGTCNGLQHFSAMLRDEVGGRAVNLVPSDKPQDIYQRVAGRVIERLEEIAGGSLYTAEKEPRLIRTKHWIAEWGRLFCPAVDDFVPVNDEACPGCRMPRTKAWGFPTKVATPTEQQMMAQQWLAFGITRKTTKRPVMILPYGGTLYACRQYTKLHLQERVMLGEQHPFGDDVKPAVQFLASIIWSSIGDVVVAAKAAMGWLQKVARVMSEAKLPITWTTPVGFPVRQAYPNLTIRRINTMLNGETYKPVVQEEGEGLDLKRQITGISPNFVHSMDGAALMASVCKARRLGIDSFAMIHDSYGTVAADTLAMAYALREAFVEMYQDQDVLASLLQVPLSEVVPDVASIAMPSMGSLDIKRVKESDFFFA